jgi:asparagine synthase (glutamine-hydrolysing)
MSGVCGLFHRTGATASAEPVQLMLAKLRHRGPDGEAVWHSGPAALGHCMLRVTPESFHENLPATDLSGQFVITADARIDNRDELIAELDVHRPARDVVDSEIILAAYKKWGERCPEKLLGDFAFAIWDAPKQAVFCASDPMGVKSIYYYIAEQTFYFASELKAVVAVPEVPRELNETRVAEYLVGLFEDRAGTFYKDILRLPGAHSMLVTRHRVSIQQYWSLDPKRELRLRSNDEYVEAFREVFAEAVRCRVRSAFSVGSAVSGGLDSSSIACMARNLRRGSGPIHTYSLIFPSLPEEDLRVIDERREIQTVLDSGGFVPHFVEADRISPMWQEDRVHFHLDQANFAPNLYLHWAMYDRARSDGVRVFLDGFDGDAAVSHGFERLAELVQHLQWLTLCREIAMLSGKCLAGAKRRRIFKRFCVVPLAPRWVCLAWQILRGRSREALGSNVFISEDLKRRTGIEHRANELLRGHIEWAPFRTARETHYQSLTQQLYSYTLEMTDKAAAAFQIEARYPFFDRRLMEFCLSIPASQKLANGWNRWTMRQALSGVLPPEIQWRPKKGNLSPNFHRRLLDFERERLDDVILRGRPELDPYVDSARIKAAYSEYARSHVRSQGESLQLFAVVNLALWLRSSGLCPQTQLHAAA